MIEMTTLIVSISKYCARTPYRRRSTIALCLHLTSTPTFMELMLVSFGSPTTCEQSAQIQRPTGSLDRGEPPMADLGRCANFSTKEGAVALRWNPEQVESPGNRPMADLGTDRSSVGSRCDGGSLVETTGRERCRHRAPIATGRGQATSLPPPRTGRSSVEAPPELVEVEPSPAVFHRFVSPGANRGIRRRDGDRGWGVSRN